MSVNKVSAVSMLRSLIKFGDELADNELLNKLDNADELSPEDVQLLMKVTEGITLWHSACNMLGDSLISLEDAGVVNRGVQE